VAIPRRESGDLGRGARARIPVSGETGLRVGKPVLRRRLVRGYIHLGARDQRLRAPIRRRSTTVEIQRGRIMKTVDITFIAIGASWLLVGMLLGIGMGAAHNFALAPLHAHINLIGFVCHSIFGMAYRHWPALKDSPLAPYQFWIFVVASPITLIGLYFTVMNGPELPTIVGSIAILVGAALFALMIWTERMRT
jgi:hypothetical protein